MWTQVHLLSRTTITDSTRQCPRLSLSLEITAFLSTRAPLESSRKGSAWGPPIPDGSSLPSSWMEKTTEINNLNQLWFYISFKSMRHKVGKNTICNVFSWCNPQERKKWDEGSSILPYKLSFLQHNLARRERTITSTVTRLGTKKFCLRLKGRWQQRFQHIHDPYTGTWQNEVTKPTISHSNSNSS